MMRLSLFSTAALLLAAVVSAGGQTSPDATCGGANGYTCQGSAFGNCCSVNGWCGSTDAYCGSGCQADFGTCTGSSTPPSQPSVSTDGSCGGAEGFTCQGSTFGNCCSVNGWCGSADAYCGSGCNSNFGTCTGSGSGSSTPPSGQLTVTPDGTCGGTTGYTCAGSIHGSCCSPSGWCGDDARYCQAGCQVGFGSCWSPDGTCGGANDFTCVGSGFGDCCSQSGKCGTGPDYCNAGCQSAFGKCGISNTTNGECGSAILATCAFWGGGLCCSGAGWCGEGTNYCGDGCQSGFGECSTPGSPTNGNPPPNPSPACRDLVTDPNFEGVTAINTTNVVSGGWKFTGSAEVWTDADTDDTEGNDDRWVAFNGDGTISQDITGLEVGDKPFTLGYAYSVRELPNGGTGACDLTVSLAGTQIEQLALNESSTPNDAWEGSSQYLPTTVTGGELLFTLECSQPLRVYLDLVAMYQFGGPSCP